VLLHDPAADARPRDVRRLPGAGTVSRADSAVSHAGLWLDRSRQPPFGHRRGECREPVSAGAVQIASPGTPIIYGSAAGVTNFRTGGFVQGAAESALINTALVRWPGFYGLPNTQAGCLTDAQEPGAQAMLEKMVTTLPLVLAGVDVINGIGEMATSQLLVQEQILVDHELACLCQRLKDGIEVGDNQDFFEDVARLGPGGHYLMEDNTVKACRSRQFLHSQLAERSTYEEWLKLGRPDMYAKARKKVQSLLAAPLKQPLPEEVVGKLEDIMRRADEELRSWKDAVDLGSAPVSGAVTGVSPATRSIGTGSAIRCVSLRSDPTGEDAGWNTRGRVCSPLLTESVRLRLLHLAGGGPFGAALDELLHGRVLDRLTVVTESFVEDAALPYSTVKANGSVFLLQSESASTRTLIGASLAAWRRVRRRPRSQRVPG